MEKTSIPAQKQKSPLQLPIRRLHSILSLKGLRGLHPFQPAQIIQHQPASLLTPPTPAACQAPLQPITTILFLSPTLDPLGLQTTETGESQTAGKQISQQWEGLVWTISQQHRPLRRAAGTSPVLPVVPGQSKALLPWRTPQLCLWRA